jgi:hypothetical protein
MLRKTFAAGGMGNLSGTNTDLINSLDKWYDGGTVLIEPFLDFTAIIGSLVTLTDSGCIYRGLDLQLVRNNSWSGLRYPVANSHIAAQIKHASMIAAESVHALGARGNMNIDWGVLKNKDDSETPMALECNFRHNGFSHLLNFGLNRFKSLQDLHILYEENIKIGDERTTFSDMMEKLSPLLVKSKKSPRGILPIGPPNRGLCNIAIFEPTAESIDNTYSCLKALTSI